MLTQLKYITFGLDGDTAISIEALLVRVITAGEISETKSSPLLEIYTLEPFVNK